MVGKMDSRVITTAAILGLMLIPVTSYSRVNSLTGGIGTYFDYSERNYDSARRGTDVYRSIGLRPMIEFESTSEKDSYLFRAAPSINYDLENSETDWNNNLKVAADRFLYKSWQLSFSDTFVRSDYYSQTYNQNNNIANQPAAPTPGVPEVSNPTLTSDFNRRRYWTNTLNVASNNFYGQDSLVRLGFNYDALRNDNSGSSNNSGRLGYDDYDRYVASFLDEHRFNVRWKTTADFEYVIGKYDNLVNANVIQANNQLSRDLKEYHLQLGVENDSITHNPLSLDYNYIGTNYDDPLRNDVAIHQMRATWKREYSPHLYTRLGAGPSYGKAEGSSANWGGNGVAELNYLVEHGYFNFKVDKRYGVDNFSGNYERGVTDSWESRFSLGYNLLKYLRASGDLSYLSEDRKYQFSDIAAVPSSYHKDVYMAGVGLAYDFWQNYTASIDYSYLKQNSDRIDDSYDDHRIVLTLSWQNELYHW